MAAPAPASRHWPVLAWIRLRLPPTPPPMVLMGPPPPPSPPLETMVRRPVMTDPRKQIYVQEAEHDGGVIILHWDGDNPEILEAEFRAPRRTGFSREAVRPFWDAVKVQIAELGPLPIEAADPRP